MSKKEITKKNFEIINEEGALIKAWTTGVLFESQAKEQLKKMALLPFIYKWIAVMPDVHKGLGATVGSVIATRKAVIPAAVGVDIGCGMMAVKTDLKAKDLPEDTNILRSSIEKAIPHGRTNNGGPRDKGAWGIIPVEVENVWETLRPKYETIISKHPRINRGSTLNQLGTLGGGNHFIEICLDEQDSVWFMLHSGSRGVGNRIGAFFIGLAKEEMRRWFIDLPDKDLAYFPQGTTYFDNYIEAVNWAQLFAQLNRDLMMQSVIKAIKQIKTVPAFNADLFVVNCHHNYVAYENHYGENVLVTRKGAVRARENDFGIIPGSMGVKSYIVKGLGNPESFNSCSHGAGRAMSRTEAKRQFTIDDHLKATIGVDCRKDISVIDETPGSYKPIDQVMYAQRDLVEPIHTLKQIVCVKG